MCTPAGRGRRRRALGHLAHLRVRRDPRLLRPAVLVHVAGLGARARPDLDEQERGGQAARPRRRSRTAASSPSASPRRRTAPTSTRPTWCSRPDGDGWRANGRKYYIGNGNEAAIVSTFGKHRRHATSTSSSPPTRARRATTWSRTSCASQNYVSEFALRDYPVEPRPTSCTAAATPGTPRSTPSTSASTTSAGRRSASARTRSTRRSRTPRNRVLYKMHVTDFPHVRQNVRRRLLPPRRDEALRAARRRLHARRRRPRTAATCSTTRW